MVTCIAIRCSDVCMNILTFGAKVNSSALSRIITSGPTFLSFLGYVHGTTESVFRHLVQQESGTPFVMFALLVGLSSLDLSLF